jgi:hypothetical protein
MSYCRFGDADAYIYMTYTGFDCCGCALSKEEIPKFTTARMMLDHITQHRAAGHYIPEDVDIRIMAEYPDPDASVVETNEEREQRLIDSAPQRERIRAAMKKAYEESQNVD